MSRPKGSKLSEKHKRNIALANKGKAGRPKGYFHSAETRLKMSKSKSGKKQSPSHAEKSKAHALLA